MIFFMSFKLMWPKLCQKNKEMDIPYTNDCYYFYTAKYQNKP